MYLPNKLPYYRMVLLFHVVILLNRPVKRLLLIVRKKMRKILLISRIVSSRLKVIFLLIVRLVRQRLVNRAARV